MKKPQKSSIKLAIVVPHIFLHKDIINDVIFSPGQLALELANNLKDYYVDVTLCTPGPVNCNVKNLTADLSLFNKELKLRGDTYISLLKKHPFTFVSLARQVQSELIANVYNRANNNEFDIVHVYTNEEDIALHFAKLCNKPVLFTHHDPYNFMAKYKSVFPKYKHLNWVSISYAQRKGMPKDTNWVGNVYHGINPKSYKIYQKNIKTPYLAYFGRIVPQKGVHLAIKAVQIYNKQNPNSPLKLKIAGKHYSDYKNDTYWQKQILPHLSSQITYEGYIKDPKQKNMFLSKALATIMPSTFEEPFGMVAIESLASGTPVLALKSGALPEIIDNTCGIIISQSKNDTDTAKNLSQAIAKVINIPPKACRIKFTQNFTSQKMLENYCKVYNKVILLS